MKIFSMKKKSLLPHSLILLLFLPLFADTAAPVEVRFTSPESSSKAAMEYVTGVLKGAKKTIHAALYDLNSDEITQELIDAKKRGVEVLLVTDDSNLHRPAIAALKRSGIRVVDDNGGKRGLMHNKFVVLDGAMVLTGSLNFTERGFLKNNNNILLLRSAECAKIYSDEFFEMFGKKKFKNRVDRKTAADYYVKLGNTPVNIYFSPENDVERILCARLAKARKSVHFLAYSFTSEKIAAEMIALSNKGVEVTGVFEKKGVALKEQQDDPAEEKEDPSGEKQDPPAKRISQYRTLKDAGLAVRLDTNPNNMHHKVIIIDGEIVVTGSYNFTKNASRTNDENLLIIADPALAAEYSAEFTRIYNSASK